jgi:hypothetical protein
MKPVDRVRSKLTYANVMATIAMFIALGGSVYAATQINGSQIQNHTIAAKKLKRNAVVPKARQAAIADKARFIITSGDAARVESRNGDSRRDAAADGPLLKLSAGETTRVVESGPLAYEGQCIDTGGGPIRMKIVATSEEAGSIVDYVPQGWTGETTGGGWGAVFGPENPVTISDTDWGVGNGSFIGKGAINGTEIVAPGGATLVVDPFIWGRGVLGADCVFLALAVG